MSWGVGAVFALLAAPQLPGAMAQERAHGIEKQPDARAQIRHAAAVKREGRGLQGEARMVHLRRVASAYEAVLTNFPDAKAECAEASFRLGETLRTLADWDGAVGAFARVVEIGASPRWAARALLETGNVHRRAKEMAKALEAYARVVAEYPQERAVRDDAYLWMGKVHATMREWDLARSAFTKVAEEGEDAVDRIQAFDRIALSYFEEGKEAEAAAAIERCKSLFAELADEPTRQGARVKKALSRMRSTTKLGEGAEDDPDPTDPK
jgi:tetratricopeptide (TPR) repeat protein